jgi:hypothetical protein
VSLMVEVNKLEYQLHNHHHDGDPPQQAALHDQAGTGQCLGSAFIVYGSGYGSSILDECGSGCGSWSVSSADPDSGKIWTKFSGSKRHEICFSSNFSHIRHF